MNKRYAIFTFIVAGLLTAFYFNSNLNPIKADSPNSLKNVSGWAWSANIGWISFNGDNYGVKLDTISNEFSGYAWSPNIGWISFEQADLTGCPIPPCVAKTIQAKENKILTGWAKILSTNSWLSLSGKAADGSSYGVEINPQGDFSGYAWDNAIGWVSFSGVIADGSAYSVSTKPPAAALPTNCYFYAQPASVPEFSKTTLYWDCQNVKSCSIDGMAMSAKGSKEITLGKGTVLYTLSCVGLDDSVKNYPITIKTVKPGLKEVKP